VCAGVLIAREAGVSVVDSDGTPHTLNSKATIAAPAPLLSQIIPLLQAADLPSDTDDTRASHTSPYAALDTILSRARYLIFEFDGPICDLSAAMPLTTADQLRATLRTHTADLPPAPAVIGTGDPFEVIEQAAAISADLGRQIDSQLTDIETQAVTKAMPSAYVHETLAACRDSGRLAAVMSRHSTSAVTAYLDTHGLADQVRAIVAPADYPPGHLQTGPYLIEEAIRALDARPASCAVITATAAGIHAARTTGTMSIGYATTLTTSEGLAAPRAACTISSLADLTLRLRARPLPN
jgi:beta-phosphoglucomutase-like phosphatase (HAD superfamily)